MPSNTQNPANFTLPPNLGSCEGRCTTHFVFRGELPKGETCECYYHCAKYEDCCDGMRAYFSVF